MRTGGVLLMECFHIPSNLSEELGHVRVGLKFEPRVTKKRLSQQKKIFNSH